jgi:hypothetical protein
VVRSQVSNLTFSPSFGHNLCLKHPNGSCKPIWNIYISRTFKWYKEIFNKISFDPWNSPLKIQKSVGIPIPKVGTHLGVYGFIPSQFPTFPGTWNVTLGLHSSSTPLQALALVASPRLGLQHLTLSVCLCEIDVRVKVTILWRWFEKVWVGRSNDEKDCHALRFNCKQTFFHNLIMFLKPRLAKFVVHNFEAKWQDNMFKKCSENLTIDQLLSIVNYVKNYSFRWQNKI